MIEFDNNEHLEASAAGVEADALASPISIEEISAREDAFVICCALVVEF